MCAFFMALRSAGVMGSKSPEPVTYLSCTPQHVTGLKMESRYRGRTGTSFSGQAPLLPPSTCSSAPRGLQLILDFISALPGLPCPIKLNLLLFSVQLRDCNSTQRTTHCKCERCGDGAGGRVGDDPRGLPGRERGECL